VVSFTPRTQFLYSSISTKKKKKCVKANSKPF